MLQWKEHGLCNQVDLGSSLGSATYWMDNEAELNCFPQFMLYTDKLYGGLNEEQIIFSSEEQKQ